MRGDNEIKRKKKPDRIMLFSCCCEYKRVWENKRGNHPTKYGVIHFIHSIIITKSFKRL